jgi:signal transduction histidine kinase
VIGAAQGMFVPRAVDHGLRLVVESASDLPKVDADPSRLLQVLSNLLGNAMKFTPMGGQVVLSVRAVDGTAGDAGSCPGAVRFAVSDTGPGIVPEDLPHVCDWFWQAEHRARGGAGLGLAIAKGLIEAHGSRLRVESVPGQGSTFWFTVSTAAAASEPHSANRAADAAPSLSPA